jgi:predicted GNAT family acetyltransferase
MEVPGADGTSIMEVSSKAAIVRFRPPFAACLSPSDEDPQGSPDQPGSHVVNDLGMPWSIAISLAQNRSRSCKKHAPKALRKQGHHMSIRDNKDRSRFELDVEGGMAFANYRVVRDAVIITHTETPPALRGRGIASELVKGALDLIRAEGRKVVAGCSFVADYLDQHVEYADMIAARP